MKSEHLTAAEMPGEISAARRQCLDHAKDLLSSAKLILDAGLAHNIAFHLSVVALEEIGKAGMLLSYAATGSSDARNVLSRKYEDHIWKLQWAIWAAPMQRRISPKDFEEARELARQLHFDRLAGLYVEFRADRAMGSAPKAAISPEHSHTVFQLAKARLELENEHIGVSTDSEDLQWFIQTTEDDIGRARLFSAEFIAKHEALEGDTRAWVAWCRSRLAEINEEERAYTKLQLLRTPDTANHTRPKWRLKIRLQTKSLTIKPKALDFWNQNFKDWKLSTGKGQKELVLSITLNESVRLQDLWNSGLILSSRLVLMLNIGTTNLISYEFSGQGEKFFDEAIDLENRNMLLKIEQTSSLSLVYKQQALSELLIKNSIVCLLAYWSLDNDTAAPIFEPYLEGIKLLSKHDLHIDTAVQARTAFSTALQAAAKTLENWDSASCSLADAIAGTIKRMATTSEAEAHLLKITDPLWESPEGKLTDAAHAKLLCDIFLLQHARDLMRARAAAHQMSACED